MHDQMHYKTSNCVIRTSRDPMFFRTLTLFSFLSLALPGIGQTSSNQLNSNTQTVCQSGDCKADCERAEAASLPSLSVRGKWEVEDFKPSNDSVSCAVVK